MLNFMVKRSILDLKPFKIPLAQKRSEKKAREETEYFSSANRSKSCALVKQPLAILSQQYGVQDELHRAHSA